MATINDITNAAGYTGNVALGGGGGFVLDIDTRPIQQLAQYTFLYNKSQYDQRQKDADEKIKALSALTSYDAATGEGKDKDAVLSNLAELRKKSADFASKKWDNPNDKTKAYFNFQKDIADNLNVINSATARQTKLALYNDVVDKDVKLNASEKEARKKQAKRIFDETDIMTQFTIPDYDNAVPKTGTPLYENNDVLIETPNGMVKANVKQFSFTANDRASFVEGNDLMLTPPAANATQGEKDAFEQRKLAFGKTGTGAWVDATQFLNLAVDNPNYKKTATTNGINVTGEQPVTQLTNEIDFSKIKSENPIAGDVISLAERYNKYAQNRIEAVKNGYYLDDVSGLKVMFNNTDRVEDIPIIDLTKPISPKNIALLHRFESAEPDKIDKTFTSTDNAIQKEQLAEQKRNNSLDFKVAWKNANRPTGSGGGSKTPPKTIQTPAIMFGEHIDRVKNALKSRPTGVTVNYSGIDDNTRKATGITADQSITYKPDGSFIITEKATDKDGNIIPGTVSVKTGTLEELKQGYINVVKSMNSESGTQTEGFQDAAEQSFMDIFGTVNGADIYNGWGIKPTTTAAPATVPANTKTVKVKGL